MEKQLAVEWLEQRFLQTDSNLYAEDFTKAKEIEKDYQRQKMIDLLEWMNTVSSKYPMALETDNDDIVDMFLNGYYNSKSE